MTTRPTRLTAYGRCSNRLRKTHAVRTPAAAGLRHWCRTVALTVCSSEHQYSLLIAHVVVEEQTSQVSSAATRPYLPASCHRILNAMESRLHSHAFRDTLPQRELYHVHTAVSIVPSPSRHSVIKRAYPGISLAFSAGKSALDRPKAFRNNDNS